MIRAWTRLLTLMFLGSCLIPVVTTICALLKIAPRIWRELLFSWVILAGLAALLAWLLWKGLRKLEPRIEQSAREQAEFLDAFPVRYASVAICGAAALSLFLELAIIRWQGTVFEFFAFYKNFGLLACFAGLGLGYALAGRERIPLGLVIPLLAWQFALLISLRNGLPGDQLEILRIPPFREQLNMGLQAVSVFHAVAVYFFLCVTFLLTALAFLPVGQLCGRLMAHREKLVSYGLNLAGSLCGVLLIFLASALWTPPVVWFALGVAGILLFYKPNPRGLAAGIAFAVLALMILAWPVGPLWQKVYSPYQLLEVGFGERGWMLIRAAGHYYQRVHDLSAGNANLALDPKLRRIRDYYELPYRIHPRHDAVAVVGAGTGNDVAAALRTGAKRVDAIEIDPAILLAGRVNHPEQPYTNPRVRAIVNDARSFLRNTPEKYDLIVYGLLDSHTLLSHASSVRLDSFVYTVEGLREARARLNDSGAISLSFSILNDELAQKIYNMMREAFDGHPPVCIRAGYDGSSVYLQSRDGDLAIPPQVLQDTGFRDISAQFASSATRVEVSTDDWPFFYMPRRVYPVSYLAMIVLVLLLSWWLKASFFSEASGLGHACFFFLGAGFMLVETKGITEMGLTFGNTWQVIGIVIAGILMMAFLANAAVQWLAIRRPFVPFLLLLGSLVLGWYVSHAGGLPSTPLGRLGTALLLTCPIFFSGIVFSALLANRGEIAGIMAANLLGAMCGGLLEYNSMYFGFQFLYWIALVFYVLALVTSRPVLGAAS